MPRKNSPPVSGDEKYCHSCASAKPKGEFWRESRTADGLMSQCNDCASLSRRTTLETRRMVAEIIQGLKDRREAGDGPRLIDLAGIDGVPEEYRA